MSRTRQKKVTQHIAIKSAGVSFFQNLAQWSIELVMIQYVWFEEEMKQRCKSECPLLRSCLHLSCILQEPRSVTEINTYFLISPSAYGMCASVAAVKVWVSPVKDIHYKSEKDSGRPRQCKLKILFSVFISFFTVCISKVSAFSEVLFKLANQAFLLGCFSTVFRRCEEQILVLMISAP